MNCMDLADVFQNSNVLKTKSKKASFNMINSMVTEELFSLMGDTTLVSGKMISFMEKESLSK